ncbi:DUF3310 domain-containing protein [Bifidobacterium amazonense]|uniref:DUF3310 domain-containing protein n=1 Tax=Bifidobacterium amazonense TaxID=2809027 RepID=A0ABS9VSC1_9BIFI|nr:DUF3310 domain-containing protein [Bifidobacterium amazonense]MCH9274982.1 DUF3310 domain-containing protein [Bifidobacterium amazonense]
MSWINDPINSPKHYTDAHPGMECIDLTADTSFCLGNCIKYLWRYKAKSRPVEDLEKARWYLCRAIDRGETIAWTRLQRGILKKLALPPTGATYTTAIWIYLYQGDLDTVLDSLDQLIEHERNQQ